MTAVMDRGAKVLLGLLGMLPCGVAAQPSQPDIPVEIRERVLTEVGSRWSTPPRALAVDWTSVVPTGPVRAADPVQLRGDGSNGWFLLVVDPAGQQPFSMRVRAGRVTTLPVAARHLRRDEVLEPEDIAHVTDTVWGPPPVEGELIAVPGWRVRRNVRMGAPLVPPVAMPPPLIELGDRVEVIWQRGAVAISIEGTATHSAKLGDQVRIRLIDGRGTVRGVAVAPGRAEMETRNRAS